MEFEEMSKDELILANKRLYARLKKVEQDKKETEKRDNLLEKGSTIKIKNLVFKPGKTPLLGLIEDITTERKPESGELYGFRPIIRNSLWKAWISKFEYPRYFKEFKPKSKMFVIVNKQAFEVMTFNGSEMEQKFESIGNKELPAFTFIINRVRNDTLISKDYRVSDIPLSNSGYGACYFN